MPTPINGCPAYPECRRRDQSYASTCERSRPNEAPSAVAVAATEGEAKCVVKVSDVARSWTSLLSILWHLFRATLFWLHLVGIGVGGHGGGHGSFGGHRSGPHR